MKNIEKIFVIARDGEGRVRLFYDYPIGEIKEMLLKPQRNRLDEETTTIKEIHFDPTEDGWKDTLLKKINTVLGSDRHWNEGEVYAGHDGVEDMRQGTGLYYEVTAEDNSDFIPDPLSWRAIFLHPEDEYFPKKGLGKAVPRPSQGNLGPMDAV